MEDKFFRLNAEGYVVGISHMDQATAEANLQEGEYLVVFDPAIDYRTTRRVNNEWVTFEVDTSLGWRKMRETGFSDIDGDQIGVLMKIVAALLAGEEINQSLRDEFQVLFDRVQAIKEENPKS